VVTLSSCDGEEALELLSLSPGRGVSSRPFGGMPWSPRHALVVTYLRISLKPMI
jgi:hypothetical protein